MLKSVETDKVSNSKVLYYYYGANQLVAQEEYKETQSQNENLNTSESSAIAGTYLLYHFNNVGSTTAVTDEKGNIKYQYQYSPYGELIQGIYGQVAFLYNGQYGVASDDNGLYYMRARYYNIDIKRFINQDVVTGSIERSSSLNRYAYVEGNPVSYIDPFGLEPWDTSEIHQQLELFINIFTYATIGSIVGAMLFPLSVLGTGSLATICGGIATGLSVINGIVYIIDACRADSRETYFKALVNAITNFGGAILGQVTPVADLTFTSSSISEEAAQALDWLIGYLFTYCGGLVNEW